MLYLAALIAAGQQLMPRYAHAQAGPPELFEPGPPTLSEGQQQRLAKYRSDRAVAEAATVQLRTDILKSTNAIRLNLPTLGSIPVDVISVRERGQQNYSWHAKGKGGDDQTEISIVVQDGDVVGTIRSRGRMYRLQPLGDGAAALIRIDPAKLPPLGEPLTPGRGQIQQQGSTTAAPAATGEAADTGAEYTAIVAYTTAAANWSGNIAALIQLAEDDTNQSYVNSGVSTRLRIVHKYQTNYIEAGAMSTDLSRYQTVGDGYADEVHAKRDQYAADVAVLITEAYDWGGMAYIYPDAASAFAVVAVNAISGYIAFQHEIGHIQGARHNPEQDASTWPFSYGHGYYYEPGRWKTIMSYDCPAGCWYINYWSNPNLSYDGVPMGNASVSNNTRVLNETASKVANFRTGPTGPVWHAWESHDGNLASYPECELTASGMACWARSASGTLTWNRSTDGNTWSGWIDLGGNVAATPECLVRGSRIDCFVTTSLKKLAQITYNGTSWGAWANRGGTVVDRPSCVPASSGLALNCFARGTNNALWRLPFDGTTWKAWQSAGGSTTLRPECVRRGTGIDCFIVNSSKNLQTRRLNGSTWGTWKQIGTGFGLPPHCLVSSNTMDCFAQSSARQLLKGYYNGSTWATWTNQGGDVYAQPYCNRLSTGFDCYWTTTTFKLIRRERHGTTWQAQVDLGGSVQQRPVCLARNNGARIDCMVRGQDNTLQQRSYY
jgi:hypothetical protein